MQIPYVIKAIVRYEQKYGDLYIMLRKTQRPHDSLFFSKTPTNRELHGG